MAMCCRHAMAGAASEGDINDCIVCGLALPNTSHASFGPQQKVLAMAADMQRSRRRSDCAKIAQRIILEGRTFLSHRLSTLHQNVDRVDERLLRLSQCDRR